jgi:hypothetical protein
MAASVLTKVPARLGDQAVTFTPIYREGNTTVPVITFTASLPLSAEDVTAALWLLVCDGVPVSELADSPAWTHELVSETVLANAGDLDEVRRTLALVKPGDAGWDDLAALQGLVERLYVSLELA